MINCQNDEFDFAINLMGGTYNMQFTGSSSSSAANPNIQIHG